MRCGSKVSERSFYYLQNTLIHMLYMRRMMYIDYYTIQEERSLALGLVTLE